MDEQRINDEYFEWMCGLICGNRYAEAVSYRKLLAYLHSIEFTYSIPRDKNRAEDGIEFRYHFGNIKGYSDRIISKYIDDKPCSVLEMIVALAFRVENEIMDDSTYGNRTGQWFWNMIVSLGLGNMNDDNFDESYTRKVIYSFLNHEYEKNGRGGLFTIPDCQYDMRTVEIWTQFMWYLSIVGK